MGQRDEGPAIGRAVHRHGQRPLEGARVLVTRSPDRAGTLTAQLRLAGAEPLLLPLKDFERASDQAALDEAFDALGSGQYEWLVISSVTTVMALQDKADARRVALPQWIPAATRVAAVGPSTRRALEASGIGVHVMPRHDHSAAGLIGEWPEGPGRVLLPQADIAAPALAQGLSSKGAEVQTVVAYHTVDYPADPGRRLAASTAAQGRTDGAGAPAAKTLTPAEAKASIDDGGIAAVVAASPSAARRISAMLSPLGACRFVAIGKATAAEAEALGLAVAATAGESTPEGLVAAVVRAVHAGTAGNPDLHSSASGPQ
jgi:uroporphyrinogen-III synthase